MSFAAILLVLAGNVALANALYCSVSLGNAVLNSPTTLNTLSAGSTASATCLPGYVTYDSSYSLTTSISVTCLSTITYTGASATYTPSSSCSARQDWCPANINANFGNTSTVTAVFSRVVGNSVYLQCKPVGLGRNYKGNGTKITVTCDSSADGTTGMWVSDDWCSGALGVSANLAVLALAAVAGLLYKRFF